MLTVATTGARSRTRSSLTTTAIATTEAPAVPAAATTWPTSWMLAPVQMPSCRSVSPSGWASRGSSTIATVPNSVTIATPTATSSSSAPAASCMAAMAEAPQIAKPVPIRSARARPSFMRFPSQVVTTSVLTRATATRAMVPRPSAPIDWNDTVKPSRTTPTRSSFLVTRPRPGRAAAGSSRRLVAAMPSATAQVRMPTAGTNWWASTAPRSPRAAASSPGQSRVTAWGQPSAAGRGLPPRTAASGGAMVMPPRAPARRPGDRRHATALR